MRSFIVSFLRLLGLVEHTVDSAVASLTKAADVLHDVADAAHEEAANHTKLSEDHEAAAVAALDQRDRARRVANRVSDLTL